MPAVVLRGAEVVDGTGARRLTADVAVADGRIAALLEPGAASGLPGALDLDVAGLVVAPGFVDLHAHSDLAVLADPDHSAKLAQGVTLEVVGQDGLGYAPVTEATMTAMRAQLAGWNGEPPLDYGWRSIRDYLDRIDAGAPLNVATLVPHGTVRMSVLGTDPRAATAVERARMREIVAQGLRDGAVGVSAGLSYVPGMFASDEEIADVIAPLAEFGGYYSPHHRNYGSRVVESYRDCLELAARAGVPLHLAHCHVNFPRNRGRAGEVLALVEAARAAGRDVTLDAYPYTASATYLASVLPSGSTAHGPEGLRRALEDPASRAGILHELEVVGSDGQHGMPIDWATTVVASVARPGNDWAVGSSIAELAVVRGVPPGELFCELLLADEFGTGCLMHVGNEENVREIMRHPAHTIGTDGILVGAKPHPRGWGSFPRFLGHYVRELGVLGLEEAVAHVTGNAARRLGVLDRGVVRARAWADLVVFDPATIGSPADYAHPTLPPTGIAHVLVNGEFAMRDGVRTAALAGRAVRRTPA
ncbi:MAG: D-aminoacylase [Protaetiibacter sp.]